MVLTRGKNPGNTDGDEQDPDTVDGEANDDDIEPLEAELVPERSSSRIRERSLDEKPNSRSFRSDTSEKNRGTPSSAGSAKSQNAIQSTSTSAQTKSGHFILNLAAEDTPLSQRWSASKKKGKRLTLFSGDSTSSRTKQRSSNNIDDPIYDSSDEERAEVKSTSRPSRNRRHRQTNCDEVVKHEESYDGMEHDVKKLRPTRRRWQSDIDEQVVKEEENSYDEVETGVKKTRPTRSCSQWRRNIYEPEEKEEENSCDEIELAVRNTRPTRSRRQCQQDIEEHEGKHDENSRDEIEPNKKSRPTRNRQQWPNYADEQVEKQDEHSMDCTGGVRRSTRNRKPMYGSFQVSSHNSSWLFGYQPVKGYPKDQEEEEDGKQRRSARIRMLQREDVIDEEDDAINSEREEEEEEESRGAGDNDFGTMEPMTTRSRRVIKKAVPYNDDMYSRVKRMPRAANHYKNYRATTMSSAKRTRQPPRRNRFTNMPSTDESSMELDSGSENEAEADEANAEGQKNKEGSNENGEVLNNNEDGRRVKGKYLLRRILPSIDRFQPHAMDTKQSSRSNTPPPRLRSSSNRRAARMICSPAHRTLRKRRQRAQNASSTSSSSSDDERFERRKNKSMVKARNRCLPMNFNPDDLSQGVIKDRMKIGSSLADVDPMAVDRSVTFEQVGGLDTYIRSLKEMILFPLLYPEVFQKFGIQPPRGVLFYGPPGTGKTLVARALANECSQKDRRVAFFMRKGADCLSKWVGESERQLRLLFDQAYQMRPSIIFFDEIDGLAPVRSTRQDQIHSSIVSTLLALMDGLDSRGEVIIIGATNRLDAIDPALRRPGRFDREFHFPLPSHAARKEILGIHLKSWNPPPGANLINYLSEKTVGYCGADLKALCAEAALLALRRRYPQVYSSKDKLLLDLSQISVDRRDFVQALQRLVPASQRSSPGAGKPLSEILVPLLSGSLQALIQHTQKVFPQGMAVLKVKGPLGGAKKLSANQFSPRLLVSGESCTHLASALLHHLERLPVHRLDLTSLYGLSVRNPEEACVQLFQEARRNVPSIIYLPQVGRWWPAVSETVRATFMSLLNELEPELPILLLVTHDGDADQCSEDVAELFDEDDDEIFRTRPFSEQERRKFFFPVLMEKALKAPPTKKKSNVQLEVLPVAPPPPPRDLSEREKARLERKEEATLRELRIFLREILAKLARNKLFFYFTQPVDVREVSDYLDIIQTPMDLETMMTKIDQHCYESAKDFLADIELIWSNALEYNPYHTSQGKLIRHRACTLRDTAYALIKAEMDTDFEEQCQEISRNRKARHVEANPTAEPAPVAPSDDMAAAQNGAAEVADNAEKQDADVSASRKRRKVSAWSRGNSNRRAKKGKADADHSSGNVSASGNNSANGDASANATYSANENTNDNIEPEDDYVTTGEMAADVDAAPIQTEESEEKPDVDLVDLIVHHEPDQVVEVSTVVEDSVLDESHYSEAADAVEDASPVAIQVPCSTTPCNLPTKVVKVDTDHLEQLLDLAVCRTADFSLERMLRLYSKLNRLIVRYSRVWDRTALVQDLETVVKRATDREV